MKKLVLLIIVFCTYIDQISAQIQIGMNKEIVNSKLIPISEEAYEKFIKTKTVLILHPNDFAYRDAVLHIINNIWTLTPMIVDSLAGIDKYKKLGNYSFISLNPNTPSHNKKNLRPHEIDIHDINITWDLWMYGDEGKDFEIIIAKIPCLVDAYEVKICLHKIIDLLNNKSYIETYNLLRQENLGKDLFFPPLTHYYFTRLQDNIKPNSSLNFYNKTFDKTNLSRLQSEEVLLISSEKAFAQSIGNMSASFNFKSYNSAFFKNIYRYRYQPQDYSNIINRYYNSEKSFYYFNYGYFKENLYYYILDARQNKLLYLKRCYDERKIGILDINEFRNIYKDIKKA